MRTFNRTKILLALLMLVNIKYSKAQSPLYDANWSAQTSLSDEFTGSTLNTSMWCAMDFYSGSWPTYNPVSGPCGCCTGGNEQWDDINVSVANGICSLKIEAPTGTYPYTFSECCKTGGIKTVNEDYTYGYMEMYAKLPGFVDGGGVARGNKFFPAFWAYHQEFNVTNPQCVDVHDEIDMLEAVGPDYLNCLTYSSGVWHETTDAGKCTITSPCTYCNYNSMNANYTNSSALCSSFNKYGVEWNTDRIIFYFNDVPFYSSYNDPSILMDPLRAVITAQLDGGNVDFYANTPFPIYYQIEYFRYYKLIKSGTGCSTSATMLNNTDLANYTWGVKSDITFGNGSGTISLYSSDKKTFRAVNTITINGEFTVPLGAECVIIPTPCN